MMFNSKCNSVVRLLAFVVLIADNVPQVIAQTTSGPRRSRGSRLASAAIAGIVIAVVIPLLLCCLLACLFMRRRRMQRSPSAGGHGAGAVPYGGGYDSVHGGRGRFGTGRFGGGMFGGNRAAGPYAHQNMGQAGAGGPTMPEPTYGGVGDKQGYAAPPGPPPYRQA